ncbi:MULTISPECIES: SRPBCC family protein [unclassified Flavobacterium]|uniref:SRPBCC family protein n=1 Tax=unclassified Flavobacterium TaxID=196869 RepID=UPI001060EF0E|nr:MULTISPECIES: SRPBCC family protein [unclassified Flavobacterium]TDP00229.1 putative membrane protein [Flavobacterium sp. 245]TDW52163.1 putative membrane protein [Flavobacterium sp. 270]
MKTTTSLPEASSKGTSKIKTNVSALERILMITSGGYLLYKGLSQNDKSIAKIGSGTAMLLRGVSGYCPVYDAVDHLKNDKSSNVNIRINSVIDKPISEVYSFWRDFENLPKFMNHLESVKPISYTTSQWTAKGPGGIGKITWKAEILKDEKERLISWSSLPDASIKNAGKVVFRPSGKGTEIIVTISYHAPLGIAGESAAKLLNPYFEKLVNDDIMNFKTYLESR